MDRGGHSRSWGYCLLAMMDPVEVDRRARRLVERVNRRDDYGRLLARGDVIRKREDIGDPDEWRAQIKRQARADRIKVRTGAKDRFVYAVLAEGATAERLDEGHRYVRMLERIAPLAVKHRHEPKVVVRDGDEALFGCQRCPAIGYTDAADEVFGGPLLEDDCPHDDPPEDTALTFMHGG